MPALTAKQLWENHPSPDNPCDTTLFVNQCAIRMGVALAGAGADLSSFAGARCYKNLNHLPRHILRAQELANWLVEQTQLVGKMKEYKNVTSANFAGKPGIVFIKDGWGPTDHIDIWDGVHMKGGSSTYFTRGKQVWFWELSE